MAKGFILSNFISPILPNLVKMMPLLLSLFGGFLAFEAYGRGLVYFQKGGFSCRVEGVQEGSGPVGRRIIIQKAICGGKLGGFVSGPLLDIYYVIYSFFNSA